MNSKSHMSSELTIHRQKEVVAELSLPDLPYQLRTLRTTKSRKESIYVHLMPSFDFLTIKHGSSPQSVDRIDGAQLTIQKS